MAGLLDSIFGGGSGSADDPYADILTPAQRNHMQAQGLLAMAGAFAEAGMPSRFPIPFGSALGKAAAALGTGQDAGMKTAIENALAAQKVRDLRNMAEYRKKVLGDNDLLTTALQQWVGAGGTGAPPSTRPGGAAPPAGTYAGPGAPTEGDGEPLLPANLSLPSDMTPDFFTRGLAPKAPGGLLTYPEATGGLGVGGGGLLSPDRETFGTATPKSEYAPGGSLYPFKDLGFVPGGGGSGAPAASGAGPVVDPAAAAASQQSASAPGGGIIVGGVRYPNARAWREDVDAREAADPSGTRFLPPAAEGTTRAPTPVPEVTGVPGGTNGIDPRKRAALDAILGGMQTAQAGPSAQRLAQFAGPGAADAPADAIPEGGGLLGVAPDLRAPIEANPLARVNAVLAQIRQRESAGNYAIPPEQNIDFPRSHASGGYQFQPGTWREWTAKSGFGREYPEAYLAPPPVQDAVARYAALHGDVNASNLWGASAGNRPYPSPYGEGGGPLPQDEMIPSGPGAGGNRPPVMQAQYAAPGGGGAAMPAAPGGGMLPGGAPIPQVPGADARLNALLLELARRNAAAEVLGLGNPYGSLLSVLQGSPQYKAAIESATRGAGLPFVEEEARRKAVGGQEVDLQARAYQAALDRVTAELKLKGEAANKLQEGGILVHDGKGGTQRIQGTVEQAVKAANGLAVPELGIPGLVNPSGGGGDAGAPARGSPAGQSVFTPAEEAAGKGSAEDIFKARTVAQDAAQSIETTKEARKLLDSGIFAGAGSDKATALAKIGNALNLTGANTKETVSNTEAYFATIAGNVGRMIKQFGSGTGLSDADREYAAQMVAGKQTLDEASMRKILDINDRAGFNVINRHNTSVAGVRPGVSLTPLTVPVPPPYQRVYPEGFVVENGKGEQRVMRNGNWEPVTK